MTSPPSPPVPNLPARNGGTRSSLLVVAALSGASGLAAWAVKGSDSVVQGLAIAWGLALTILPVLGAALLLAGFVQAGIARDTISRWLGAESGFRGLAIATVAGAATPGGPMAAFPLVLALAAGGADRGALIAYITAWSLNGFQRILVWEIPILGPEFAALRFLASLPLPILAGLLARRLPPWRV
ncbi:permease [Elioraea rosea]|uniref:permease n=1 Tax=Elioraea rosea TaxID=2492390 RepID=UPI001182FEA6|nr:permease [Elioraea rosea]